MSAKEPLAIPRAELSTILKFLAPEGEYGDAEMSSLVRSAELL